MSAEVRRAAEILKRGGLVAFPTETVYGLGADASRLTAVARLYQVKRRPLDHPVIIHFADAAGAFSWAREVSAAAQKLAAKFWPGPLTLILRKSPKVGGHVTGGQDTIGLRVPSHPVAQALLREFGGGIAAPSANRFGQVSPTTASHVHQDLAEDVDLVLDGGPSEVGIESTIVDLSSGDPVMLRPGKITAAELETVLGVPLGRRQADSPRHSGGLERHYAPRTPARLVPTHQFDQEIAKLKDKVAVLAFSRPDERVDYWLRMPREPQAYAHKLYAALRELDGAHCEMILIEAPPETPEWAGVRDRLERATG